MKMLVLIAVAGSVLYVVAKVCKWLNELIEEFNDWYEERRENDDEA